MKVVRSARSTTAFVEFHDVPSAMMVHQTLQGAVLQSSDRGGIRIQWVDCARVFGVVCVCVHFLMLYVCVCVQFLVLYA